MGLSWFLQSEWSHSSSCQEQNYDSEFMACRSCSYPFPGRIWLSPFVFVCVCLTGLACLEVVSPCLHVTAELLLHPFRRIILQGGAAQDLQNYIMSET